MPNIASFKTGLKINDQEILLNSPSLSETKYIVYIRPSTDEEKIFLNSMNYNKIIHMENPEIRARESNWEPMIHIGSERWINLRNDLDSNNYYNSDNQYKYGVLFSTYINKEIITDVVVEEKKENDPCELCRSINHSSKEVLNRRLRYSARAQQSSRSAAGRIVYNCN